MPERDEVPYWYVDTDVFLSYIENFNGRGPLIRRLLDDCKDGKVSLCTSYVTMAEVKYAHWEKAGCAIDPEVEKLIDGIWHPSTKIELVEVNELIARQAKRLNREDIDRGWTGLSACDAVHLITAHREGVQEVFTYSRDWKRYEAIFGFKVCEPHLNVDDGALFGQVE